MSRSGSSISSIEIVDDDFADAIAQGGPGSLPMDDEPVKRPSTSKDNTVRADNDGLSVADETKSPVSAKASSKSEAKSSTSAKASSNEEAKSPASTKASSAIEIKSSASANTSSNAESKSPASAKAISPEEAKSPASPKASPVSEAKKLTSAKDAADSKDAIHNTRTTDADGTPSKPSSLTQELMSSLKDRTRSEDSSVPIPRERSISKDSAQVKDIPATKDSNTAKSPKSSKDPISTKDPTSPKDPIGAKSSTHSKISAVAKDAAPSKDSEPSKTPPPSKPVPLRSPPESPSGSADVSDGSVGVGAGIPRRPMGPRSRRPPTQMLLQQREPDRMEKSRAQSEVLLEVDETAAGDAVSEAVPALEVPADEPCDPVSESQDEEAPAARPRFVPRGAVPLMMPMPGLGRGGGVGGMPLFPTKPRAQRLPPSDNPAADPPSADATSPVDEPDSRPKLRSRPPPGAVGIGMSLPSTAGTDFAALRQQLRKTVAPSAFKEPLGPPPPLPPKPGAAGDALGAKPTPPPRPPPPKPKPRGGKDDAKLSASPE